MVLFLIRGWLCRAGEACCRVKVADARLRLKQYEKALDELEKAMELRGMLEDRTGKRATSFASSFLHLLSD
jgi:hypothetical protein